MTAGSPRPTLWPPLVVESGSSARSLTALCREQPVLLVSLADEEIGSQFVPEIGNATATLSEPLGPLTGLYVLGHYRGEPGRGTMTT